ncbi:FERM central domain-containing protein [Phthorimaea operculella]|nr:FERM central domain-containing protein [Phthorimaea operculella]
MSAEVPMAKGPGCFTFFSDHQEWKCPYDNLSGYLYKTASWLPPAESWPSSRDGSASSQDLDELEDLPYGWEQALDSRGKPYYINHVNKTTTYVAPEGCSCESPPAPRDVVLDRDPELGFGFVAGSERPVLVRFVTDNSPSVGKLEPGDQILCVNGEDVSCAAREHVIAAVRACTERVTLRVCQPARTGNPTRRSALLSAAKRARLRARPPRVRFADSVQLNGAPMYPPSAFSLGDLCLPPMANVLKVFLENGQTKSFKYDTTTTVADVVTSLKDKLQIAAEEHFSLVVEHVKSVRRNKLTLLDPKESLARIAARPGSHKMRCLYRVVFMPSSAAELAQRDLNALDYLYMQSCNDVAQERFAPELQPDVALRLAALHMHQHALANNFSPAKLTAKAVEREFGLERFVPCSLLESMKRKELHRLIAHFLKLNSQMTGSQRQLTQLQAKLHYLDIVASLPSYGAKCFSSTRPERVLLVSPRFGLSQIVGRGNSVPQPIASLEEVEAIRVKREGDGTADVAIFLQRHGVLGLLMDERDAAEMPLVIAGTQPIASLEEVEAIRVKREGDGTADVAIFLQRHGVLGLLMDERDAAEMPLVIAGYYRLATGQDLNVETEREPVTEDIAPPYLSQHCVVPAKWSYLHYNHPEILTKKHFAIFTMPPPYHATNEQKALDTNMNSNISNRNHSNNSSPLIGYDAKPGLLGHDVHFEKCKRNEEFRLFDNDPCYLDDGMGFDLQSVLSMELLENAANPRLVEAKNEEVLRRVAEMQKLVENSEQYLTENCDAYAEDYNGMLRDELVGRETCVDPPESDTESNTSRMSTVDDAPGILKHSDSLLLLTETINQGLNGLSIPETEKDNNSLTTRQSQGLSAILNNCGLTDALLALNTDLESDNDSSYTPTNSPIRKHLQKSTNNKIVRTSFGLHSPDATLDNKESNLREYLKQLREKSSKEEEARAVEFCQESIVDNDAELIDLTLIPPPQTPDELDSATQVPQILPIVPPSFADERANSQENLTQAPKKNDLEEFIANVTVPPPTVKVTPAIELTPEEIMSYIIPPPPPGSNTSTLDREQVSYVNQSQILEAKKELQNKTDAKPANGDVVKGTLSVSEIRNMFAAKSLSDARNSLLLREKSKAQANNKTDSPKSKRKSVTDRQSNGNAHVIEYPTVERKSMFSCCSKDKNKSDDSNDESEKIESRMPNSDSIPDVCEIRPPPRRKPGENKKPPERPPKTPPAPAPRPRSNSFTCINNELSTVEIPNNHFSTLNNRKLNYKVVCDINEENHISHSPPSLPPRLENRVLSPPPPILLPPKKPPLPPVPSIEVLRMKTSQKQSPVRNPEQRLASIGSPHFQRNLNTYRNLEIENRLTEEEPPNIRSTHNYSSMTLQNRHTRSNSETKNTILKNKEMSPALSLCSPQMNRRFSNRPDILNGAPGHDQRVFSPPLSERKAFRDGSSPVPKVNHVRFKDDVVDDIPTPPSPPAKFPEIQGNNGHVSIENLLCKTEVAVDGLLQRLHQAAQKCSHQHAHGGGEDIDEAKFQRARSELTSCAVSLVGASRTLVGALGSGKGSNAASALADCLAPLRRLSDLAQALGRHTSAPLQTRNLVLRVHDVTAAFKDLAGAEMAQIIHEHNAKKNQNQDTDSTLEGQLALRAECLANVLATLLRSLRVFSP